MIGTPKNFVLIAVLIVVVSSQDFNHSCSTAGKTEELEQLKIAADGLPEDLRNEIKNFESQDIKNEDVVVFFGTTGYGKSSLMNYIIGNKLIAKKNSSDGMTIALDGALSQGPPIETLQPNTEIPTRWEPKKLPGFGIWNTPTFGFPEKGRTITNAAHFHKLVKNVKSVKIVLVTDIGDIESDKIESFSILLNFVFSLVKCSMRESFRSISVIFTNVPKNWSGSQVDKEFVSEILKRKFLSSGNIRSELIKEYIEFLIKNNQLFGLFKKPITEGDINDASIDEGIIQAIDSTVTLPNIIAGKSEKLNLPKAERLTSSDSQSFFSKYKTFIILFLAMIIIIILCTLVISCCGCECCACLGLGCLAGSCLTSCATSND